MPGSGEALPKTMTQSSETTITRLLDRLQGGDRDALDALFPLVYEELRLLAHGHRRRWDGDDTLGTTVLVNEAYLKLAGQSKLSVRSRAHFLGVAAKAMRHILCNHAEARGRIKRGGGVQRVSLDALDAEPAGLDIADDQADTLAAVELALRRLDATNARLARVVECRFFAGMSIADTAEALDTSPATVKRDWLLARAWLYRELQALHEA